MKSELLSQHTEYIEFARGQSLFSFLPSGDVRAFTHGGCLINGFIGSQREGSANNIWLRFYEDGRVRRAIPLLGVQSSGAVSRTEDLLAFTGEEEGVAYRATFFPAGEGIWFWDVELSGAGRTVDLVYGQDIGVGQLGAVLTNELYLAQYLDHTVHTCENGFAVTSRQNQAQEGKYPCLQQGMAAGRAVGYSTDATQFFGLSYKEDQIPRALLGDLQNINKQFELSYTALQTEKTVLAGNWSAAFYGVFLADHPDAARAPENRARVQDAYRRLSRSGAWEAVAPVRFRPEFPLPGAGGAYSSPSLTAGELDRLYPERRLEEKEGAATLSFFTGDHAHVALKEKELLCERPHGTIITTLPRPDRVDSRLITSTHYIYGLFNAQTVIGNTSFNKLISTQRGLLNILKNHGQRLFVRIDGAYRLLTLPAAFEMGMNYSRWLYKIHGDLLTVTCYAEAQRTSIVLEARSRSGTAYDMVLTSQLVMGDGEWTAPVRVAAPDKGTLRVLPDEDAWKNSPYPGLCYDIQPEGGFSWSDDRLFFEDGRPRNGTLLTISLAARSAMRVTITGYLEEPAARPGAREPSVFEEEKAAYLAAYAGLNRGFHLSFPEPLRAGIPEALREQAEKLNETAWWYTHNAMVHFAVPHGLEQPGGAAWGTRDVCQGPMEFLLATQHNALARDVLLRIFSHQQRETGEWPQWFMFDRYTGNAGGCHGDVVFWPLKCAADYIMATGDESILDEALPFAGRADGMPCGEADLLAHLTRAVESIEGRFLPGTRLISYAGGDWDDTLQPADPRMKDRMVSAWTQALAFQAIGRLGSALRRRAPGAARKLDAMAREIQAAFLEHLVKDGVIAGFAYQKEDGSFQYLLHPRDTRTGIRIRLLPMTRSIIAQLVGKEQAAENSRLIDEKLKCPDGVRLMDHPAPYDGGVSRFFLRAEQAANVGREISLQYTHAHIRYIEAMAKLGDADAAWDGLFNINPILLREAVPNAARRQSNLYFSSSDGDFSDRYQYSREFGRLLDGSVAVKGGWRLYSSGPGIYLNQVVSHVLGIRFIGDCLELDPMLPASADGLCLRYMCFGRAVRFVFHKRRDGADGVEVRRDGKALAAAPGARNRYRTGGVLIEKSALPADGAELHVFF